MEFGIHILTMVGIYAILAMSLDAIVGYAGIPALGHAAFSLIGAYTSSLLSSRMGISPWFGMLAGAGLASLTGALVSYSSLRLKGDYLALATLGLGIITYNIAKNWVGLTRGPMGISGIPRIYLFGFEISGGLPYLVMVWIAVACSYGLLRLLTQRPFGRVLKAIREDDIAAAALGKRVTLFKLKVFMLGAFFAGAAGGLYAHYIQYIDPNSFSVMESVTILLMVILGGMGTLKGALLGAFLLIGIPESLRLFGLPTTLGAPVRQMIYGFLLTILMIYRPHGILGKYWWR